MVDAIAWNTTYLGVWTVSTNTVEKVSPTSSWDSYNTGQSSSSPSKAYNIYHPNTPHGTTAAWIGYTRAAPNYNPGSVPFGIQFPNNTTDCHILINGVQEDTFSYDHNTKFEINMEKDYDYPTFLMDDSVVYTSGTHADFSSPYSISTNMSGTGVVLQGDYEGGAAPGTGSVTMPPPYANIGLSGL